MFSYLSDIFASPHIVPLAGILAAIVIPVISSAWIKLEKHRQECELKRCLVERGMSVEDIERVLAARTPSGPPKSREVASERTAIHT